MHSKTQRALLTIASVLVLALSATSASAQVVAAGPYHTLAVASDGTVWAWGDNTFGELGDNSNTGRKTPVQVQNLSSVVAVAAGMYQSFALKSDGTVWAWGRNNTRQLGDGTTTNRNLPVSILTGMVKIAAGTDHGLAVDTNGAVWVWGANGSGQLGTGDTTVPNSPVTLTSLTGMVAIAGGSNFSVAVKSDGTVWSWGSSGNGQLGNGSTTSSTSPVQATGVTDATAVAAGTCHALMLKSNGALYGSGCNSNGRLGDGTTTQRTSYVSLAAISNVVSMSAGDRHSVAVDSNGSVWSWGYNLQGQLGDGGSTARSTPATINGISGATVVAAGGNHNVAVTSTGIVYGWGENGFGQIGDGTTVSRNTPTAISDANFAWKAGTPVLSPESASGTYTAAITVTVTNATPNVTMRYSTDGSDPTEAHQLYSGSITVDATMVLKVKAWHATLPPSNTAAGAFTLKPKTPTITPFGGTYASAQTASISTTTGSATIRYTTDGSTPVATSPVYSSPLTVSTPTIVKAVAFRTGWTDSDAGTANFSFSSYQPAVSFTSPGAGTYDAVPVVVSFGSTEPNSQVRYSLSASSTPDELVPQPMELHKTTTVSHRTRIVQPNNAITYGPVTYTTFTAKVATPVIDLAPGEYVPGTVIQLTSATPNAILRYRLDGQAPSESDPIVPSDGKLMVGNFTLTVRGFYKEMNPSDVATTSYSVSWNYNNGAMAGGQDHSVALRPDGVVLTWGSNTQRQLGLGERRKQVIAGNPYGEIVVNPALTPHVAGITGVRAIAAGGHHTVALRMDGAVLTWGNDNAIGTEKGVLGRSTCNLEYHSTSLRTCIRPDSVGLTSIVAIAAGSNHTLALKSDGTVWAWGNNARGQVGNGSTTTQATPTQVPGLSDIVEIAASNDHSLARSIDGVVWGWGDGEFQAIGDVSYPYAQTTPIEIEDFEGAATIAAGGYMAMAKMADGTLRVRGRWSAGQLGNGTTNPNSGYAAGEPLGLGEVLAVAAGSNHVATTNPDGELWSWGYNTNGQLGNPAWGNTTVPGLVPDDVAAMTIVAAGGSHGLAIAQDGSGWAWGKNTNGQVGNGTTVDKSSPEQIFSVGTFSCDVDCANLSKLFVDGVSPPTPHITRPSSEVIVAVEDGPTNPLDWVGLFAVGAPDNENIAWTYFNQSSETPPVVGTSSAALPFTLPAEQGDYEFRLFAANGARLATSTTVVTTCLTSVSRQTLTVESQGAIDTLSVSAPLDCNWAAQVNGDFMDIISGGTGTGDGDIVVSVDANATGEVRFGEVLIAEAKVGVVQFGAGGDPDACEVVVAADVASSETGSFELATANECAWTAESLTSEIALSASEGMGASVIPYTLDPNWAPASATDVSIGAQPTTMTATSYSGRICMSLPVTRFLPGFPKIRDPEFPVQWIQICTYPKWEPPPSSPEFPMDPILTVTPNSMVERGTFIGLQVQNASGATISGWRFVPDGSTGLQPFVRTTDTGSVTWFGRVVVNGIAYVNVRRGAREWPLQLAVQVVPRDGLATPPVAAVRGGGVWAGCPDQDPMPVPIVGQEAMEGDIGQYCLTPSVSYQHGLIVGGPNSGGRYITAVTDTSTFNWIVHPHLQDTNCAFYQNQTGTYPGNPDGFISGATLLANVIRHESALVQGHYGQYRAAAADPAMNLGLGVESIVIGPPGDLGVLQNRVTAVINARGPAIGAATRDPQPYGANYAENGAWRGFINDDSYSGCIP